MKTFNSFQGKQYFSNIRENLLAYKSSAGKTLLKRVQISEIIHHYDPHADSFGHAKEKELDGRASRKTRKVIDRNTMPTSSNLIRECFVLPVKDEDT